MRSLKKKKKYGFQMKASSMQGEKKKFHSQQAGICWIITFSQPSRLSMLITMIQENNLCCWGALCPVIPGAHHRNTAAAAWRGTQKGLQAETKVGKAQWVKEADCIQFTYNREHTDITSSTILRQEDKEKRDRQRN